MIEASQVEVFLAGTALSGRATKALEPRGRHDGRGVAAADVARVIQACPGLRRLVLEVLGLPADVLSVPELSGQSSAASGGAGAEPSLSWP